MEKQITITAANELLHSRKNSISGIEHRLEIVTEKSGIEYINDSKATDFTTSWYSLSCMEKPVIWIVGVSEDNYAVFSEIVREKVKAIVCFGNYKEKNPDILKRDAKYFSSVSSLEEAIEAASAFAVQGDVILFSPACPSYEMFENYKQRGECFKKFVTK